MTKTGQEVTLTRERLHWGIFIPAVLVMVALAVMTIPVLLFMKLTANVMGQLNPQAASPTSWLLLLVLIPDAAISGIVLLATWLAYLKSEITLTSQRLIFRTGFLSRLSGELPLENVETIILMEPLLGRLCGYGTVAVSGLGGTTFPLRFVASPQRFHALLQRTVGDAKASSRTAVTPQRASLPDDDSRYMPKG